MPTQEFKTFNTGAAATSTNFATQAALKSYINSLTCVASDLFVTIDCYSDVSIADASVWAPATFSTTQRVLMRPAAGLGVNDQHRTTADIGASGIALNIARGGSGANISGIDWKGFRVLVTGSGGRSAASIDGTFAYNRIYDQSTSANPSTGNTGSNEGVFRMVGTAAVDISDNLVFVEGVAGKTMFYDPGTTVRYRRNTLVARGVALGSTRAYRSEYNTATSQDDLFIGLGSELMPSGIPATNCFSNTTPTVGRTSGITVNTTAGALVVNESNDVRPNASGPLINSATASAQGTKDILGNNRGTQPDIGAWELDPAVSAPTGTVTSIVVSGQTVTISGTTANSPSYGLASITPTATAYNSGEAQSGVAVTFGSGTFSAQFTNVKVGVYSCTITLTNSGGTDTASNPQGNINVVGATGVLTSQTLDGQQLTLSGTTSGNPVTASAIAPAAATNPNGAVTASSNVTLGSGTFTVVINLEPGNYDPPVIRFTTSAGTSLPIGGTTSVTVLGITGNPEAPDIPDRIAKVNLVGPNSDPIVQGTVLKYAWFDAATPDLFSSPLLKGETAVLPNGLVSIILDGSVLTSGQVGWLVVTDSDGNPATLHKAFSGPVTVQ